jgi:hypothetical protein
VDSDSRLHLHPEHLVPGPQPKRKSLLLPAEPIVKITPPLILDQIDLVTPNIALILIPHLVFKLHSDQNHQKPFIDYRMMIEI